MDAPCSGRPPSMVRPSGRSSAARPHARQAVDEGRDPVALLDAQLAGAGERRATLRVGGGHGQGRDLVDQRGHALGRDGEAA